YGLDIGASRDHVNSDCNTRIEAVAEVLDQVFGIAPGGQVSNLLTEVVTLPELLAENADDVFGMAIVFGKDQGLRDFAAARENLNEEAFLESASDQANLILRHNRPVEFLGAVFKILVGLLPSHFAGSALALAHKNFRSGLDFRALFCDLGADPINIDRHVHLLSNSFFVP